jgi:hypothetical protein
MFNTKTLLAATAIAVASCQPAMAETENCSTQDVLVGAAIGATVGGVVYWFANQPYLNNMRTVSGSLTQGGTFTLGRTVAEQGGWRAFPDLRKVQYFVTGLGGTVGGGLGAVTNCAYNELIRNQDLTWSDVYGWFQSSAIK